MSEPTPPPGRDASAHVASSVATDAIVLAALAVGAAVVWLVRIKWVLLPYNMGSGDAFGYFLPAYEYEAARLAAGSFPLWNPYEGGGVPFLATLQPGALYPARLLLLF